MYDVEDYGKDSLSRVTICYMTNSTTGYLNSYLSSYCEEEANYLQYSVIFKVLIPLKQCGNNFLSNILRFQKDDFFLKVPRFHLFFTCRRDTVKTEISM
jgi:hypothetical protein